MYAIRPSAAYIWMVCNGYLAMLAKYPELPEVRDNVIREEGTAGHWVAHMLGQGFIVPEGTIAHNGVEVDSEMLDGAALFLGELRKVGVPVYQESTFPAPHIHPQCGGTSDAWAWDAVNRILYVWDYKYGFRFVDAFENPQLAIYASSILDYLHSVGLIVLDGYSEMDITVVLTVVQPRGFGQDPVRSWRVKAAMMRGLWNTLRAAAHATLSDNPTLRAGSHCTDCPARHSCPSAQHAALDAIDFAHQLLPHDMTPTAMGDALRRLKKAKEFIESMESGLEVQLLHAIGNGHIDPNWMVGYGRSSTRYREGGEQELIALAKYLKLPVTKPERAKTPKQLEGVVDPATLQRFTEHRSGAKKLVPFNERTIRKLLS